VQQPPELVALHPRHHDVRDDETHMGAEGILQEPKSGDGIRGLEHVEAIVCKCAGCERAHLHVVIHDQDSAATTGRGVHADPVVWGYEIAYGLIHEAQEGCKWLQVFSSAGCRGR
jgi:hypothetical protein